MLHWKDSLPFFLGLPEADPAELRALVSEIEALALPAPHVGARFPFEEAHAALAHLRSGQSIGKVVLETEAGDDGATAQ